MSLKRWIGPLSDIGECQGIYNSLSKIAFFDTEEDVTFDITIDKETGKYLIRAVKMHIYSENYKNPPIPEGYKHILGEWNNGFVIERCTDGSQFVWVPVGYLLRTGTLNGVTFTEKFGRRNYMNEENFLILYFEPMTDEFAAQIESVEKYGGFYVSRYKISKNKETGKLQSVKGVYPMLIESGVETVINEENVINEAKMFETSENVKSHLTYGSEYDSILEWFIWSETKTRRQIITKEVLDYYYEEKTGSGEMINNVSDIHMLELTQEFFIDAYATMIYGYDKFRTYRAGAYEYNYYRDPISDRKGAPGFDHNANSKNAGFRICLCIK